MTRRDGNPPGRGPTPQLLAADVVPLEWRELYAVAVYTYVRPGELAELRRHDVDLEGGLLSVSRAWEWSERRVGPPKTRNGVRRVPIEPTLRPLLARVCEGKAHGDLIFPGFVALGENKAAGIFRGRLADAEVTATRLLEDSATHMPAGFRSLRDTGITWLALAGVPIQHMQRRAGHDDMNTTMGYVKEAEDLTRGGLGEPFPVLPFGEPSEAWGIASPLSSPQTNKASETEALVVPVEGFEPPT